ncbi:putative germin, rmlC-like cupin domain superfamily, rmlC-like jelly roll [Helianthus anomalus]
MYMIPANADGFYSCKDPKFITVNDFSFRRLVIPPTTKNKRGRISTRVYDRQLPGLNKVGASILLFDFATGDFVAPHIHYHGTEILVVLRGSILVNLNMSAPENYHFTKVVRKGDVFVIPQGLYHSVKNVGKTDAMIFTAFNQQHPDV